MAEMKLLEDTVGDVIVVDPNERYIRDPEVIDQFGDALYNLIDRRGLRKIVVDFSKVQLFSSAALGVMMAFKKKADALKTRVVICCLPRELKDIFKLVGLDKLFELYADREKALASFGVKPS
jgi:anti-anti-sigma factor